MEAHKHNQIENMAFFGFDLIFYPISTLLPTQVLKLSLGTLLNEGPQRSNQHVPPRQDWVVISLEDVR